MISVKTPNLRLRLRKGIQKISQRQSGCNGQRRDRNIEAQDNNFLLLFW